MKGKLLKSGQGITHSVFKEGGVAEAAPEEGGEEPAGEDGEAKQVKAIVGNPEDILNTFKHVYVREVVREPKMHFYRVPRLGSFMVVPLEYESCISAVSLDSSVTDKITTKAAIKEQQQIRDAWNNEQEQIKQGKESSGEPYTPEVKVWETI